MNLDPFKERVNPFPGSVDSKKRPVILPQEPSYIQGKFKQEFYEEYKAKMDQLSGKEKFSIFYAGSDKHKTNIDRSKFDEFNQQETDQSKTFQEPVKTTKEPLRSISADKILSFRRHKLLVIEPTEKFHKFTQWEEINFEDFIKESRQSQSKNLPILSMETKKSFTKSHLPKPEILEDAPLAKASKRSLKIEKIFAEETSSARKTGFVAPKRVLETKKSESIAFEIVNDERERIKESPASLAEVVTDLVTPGKKGSSMRKANLRQNDETTKPDILEFIASPSALRSNSARILGPSNQQPSSAELSEDEESSLPSEAISEQDLNALEDAPTRFDGNYNEGRNQVDERASILSASSLPKTVGTSSRRIVPEVKKDRDLEPMLLKHSSHLSDSEPSRIRETTESLEKSINLKNSEQPNPLRMQQDADFTSSDSEEVLQANPGSSFKAFRAPVAAESRRIVGDFTSSESSSVPFSLDKSKKLEKDSSKGANDPRKNKKDADFTSSEDSQSPYQQRKKPKDSDFTSSESSEIEIKPQSKNPKLGITSAAEKVDTSTPYVPAVKAALVETTAAAPSSSRSDTSSVYKSIPISTKTAKSYKITTTKQAPSPFRLGFIDKATKQVFDMPVKISDSNIPLLVHGLVLEDAGLLVMVRSGGKILASEEFNGNYDLDGLMAFTSLKRTQFNNVKL
jgi:hypothetical protein